MATADSSTLSELLTKRYERPFINLVAQDSTIYKWLPKKSMRDTQVLFKVRYAGNTSAGSYAENADLGEAGHQFFKAATVEIAQYKALVQLSGKIIEATKGHGGFMEAWTDEISNGLDDLKTNLSDDLLSALTPGNGGLDLTGIPFIIADTGTYAGIDSGVFTWWQSYVNDNISDRNVTVALMQDLTLNLRLRPRRAKTSVIFCDDYQFNNYGGLFTALRRYKPQGKMDGGFNEDALDFEGIPIVRVDGWPAQRMDFLDKRGWEYRTLLPFKSEPAEAGNVDARRQLFKHYGGPVCKMRNRQGSLQDLNTVTV